MNPPAVSETLERLCALLRHDARQRGLPHGLQPVQVEALLYLARCNHYSDTPQAVAEFLGSTKGTVSQTLKVLERAGLLVKSQDRSDRRVVRLALTPVGRSLAEELAVPPEFAQALADAELPPERLNMELRRLLTRLQRAGGHKTFGVCKSCRFFRHETEGFRCGLTGEPLMSTDRLLICREHEPSTLV